MLERNKMSRTLDESWKEQQELNKLGQNINEMQHRRIYLAGYHRAIELFEDGQKR